MGDIVGGIIGGIGSLFGGNSASKKEDEAAKTAMTGYNYLASNPLINSAQSNATSAMKSQDQVLQSGANSAGNAQNVNGTVNQLLTSDQTQNPAFQNYLNSTGYKFQLQQGQDAINSNSAAKGLLNSGATAKALTSYGQNLGSNYFNTYLGQLNTNAQQQDANANTFTNVGQGYNQLVGQGLQAALGTGQAGTTAGNNAGNFQAQAGQSQGTSQTNAFNQFGGALMNFLPF